MKSFWPLHKTVEVPSVLWHESLVVPGVKFSTRRVSLGARLKLMHEMRQLISENEFLRAGDTLGQTEAAISDLLAKQLYITWGLCEVRGLSIDGKTADPTSLIRYGPEELCDEIVESIRSAMALTEEERKN